MMDMMHLIMPDQPQSFLGKFSDVRVGARPGLALGFG